MPWQRRMKKIANAHVALLHFMAYPHAKHCQEHDNANHQNDEYGNFASHQIRPNRIDVLEFLTY